MGLIRFGEVIIMRSALADMQELRFYKTGDTPFHEFESATP